MQGLYQQVALDNILNYEDILLTSERWNPGSTLANAALFSRRLELPSSQVIKANIIAS
jgi:hypothetical protein